MTSTRSTIRNRTKPGVASSVLAVVLALGCASDVVATLIGPDSAAQPAAPSQAQSPIEEFKSHLQKREFDQALDAANKMIRENPNNSDAYNYQGGIYLEKGDFESARKSFEKAIALRPNNSQALLNLAQLDLLQNDLGSARTRYQTILAKDPKNIPAMLGMAQAASKSGSQTAGLMWLEKAKTTNPAAIAPRLYIAAYYMRTRNFPAAITELTDAQQVSPNAPDLLDLLGQAQIGSGQKGDAVLTYSKLASVRPNSPVAHLRLAAARSNNGDLSGAAESLRKALELKPDYAEAFYELAALKVRANRSDEAEKIARELQTRTPQSPAGFVLEGDVLFAEQRYADAAKAYQRASAVRETGPILVKLHAAQSRAGNAKEAEEKLQLWLKAHPDDMLVLSYLAGENLQRGRDELAIEEYELILKKFPEEVSALNNLAYLYHKVKDPRSLKAAEAAHKLMPNSPSISDTLGWILVEQGDAKRGLALVRDAAAKLPKEPEVRYHLAVALAKSGDKAGARKELETLLASDERFPQREAAQSLLKQL